MIFIVYSPLKSRNPLSISKISSSDNTTVYSSFFNSLAVQANGDLTLAGNPAGRVFVRPPCLKRRWERLMYDEWRGIQSIGGSDAELEDLKVARFSLIEKLSLICLVVASRLFRVSEKGLYAGTKLGVWLPLLYPLCTNIVVDIYESTRV